MMILAFDPGETTGYAIIQDGEVVDSGQFPMWDMVEELVGALRPNIVVYESFRLFPGLAKAQAWSELKTVKVIGVIEYVCNKFAIKWTKRTPAQRKRIGKVPGVIGPHAKDAARHGLAYSKSIRARINKRRSRKVD